MNRPRLWLNSCAVAAVLGWSAIAIAELPDVLEHIHEPLDRVGRLHGFCWGDGYHACDYSGCRPLADLPPRSYSSIVGSDQSRLQGAVKRVGHRGSTFYDMFDRRNSRACNRPECTAIGCDGIGCDAGCDGVTMKVIRGSEVTQIPASSQLRYGSEMPIENQVASDPSSSPAASESEDVTGRPNQRPAASSAQRPADLARSIDRPVQNPKLTKLKPTRPVMATPAPTKDRLVTRPSATPGSIRPEHPGTSLAATPQTPAAPAPVIRPIRPSPPQRPAAPKPEQTVTRLRPIRPRMESSDQSSRGVDLPAVAQNAAPLWELPRPQPQVQVRGATIDSADNNGGFQMPNIEIPVAEFPVAEMPVPEIPVAEMPVAEMPVAEVPVAEVPVAKMPVAAMPVAEVPVEKIPEARTPVVSVQPSAEPAESEPRQAIVVKLTAPPIRPTRLGAEAASATSVSVPTFNGTAAVPTRLGGLSVGDSIPNAPRVSIRVEAQRTNEERTNEERTIRQPSFYR